VPDMLRSVAQPGRADLRAPLLLGLPHRALRNLCRRCRASATWAARSAALRRFGQYSSVQRCIQLPSLTDAVCGVSHCHGC